MITYFHQKELLKGSQRSVFYWYFPKYHKSWTSTRRGITGPSLWIPCALTGEFITTIFSWRRFLVPQHDCNNRPMTHTINRNHNPLMVVTLLPNTPNTSSNYIHIRATKRRYTTRHQGPISLWGIVYHSGRKGPTWPWTTNSIHLILSAQPKAELRYIPSIFREYPYYSLKFCGGILKLKAYTRDTINR